MVCKDTNSEMVCKHTFILCCICTICRKPRKEIVEMETGK
jgi:hypothetical protein